MTARSYGQYCGLAVAADLLTERWALLVVRDLLVGPRRYTDLRQGLPGIPTNILAARLRELQDAGVIRRTALARTVVYELTGYGRELEPVVLALGRWGFKSMGDPAPDDVVTADSLTMALRTAFRPEAAASSLDFQLQVGAVELRAGVSGGELAVASLSAPPEAGDSLPAGEPELQFAAGPGIRHLIAGTLSAAQAVQDGVVTILAGDVALLERFTMLFRIDV